MRFRVQIAPTVLAAALLVLYGCPRGDLPAQDRDAPSSPIGRTCVSLQRVGCPEGDPLPNGRSCYDHLSDVALRINIPTRCVEDATTAADVRSCGDGKTELRFRCRIDGG